jgi:hypothetical protein
VTTLPSAAQAPPSSQDRARLSVAAFAPILAAFALLTVTAGRDRGAVPALVFVARQGVAGSMLVPGVGPGGRTRVTGGRLMVRAVDGSVRSLLPDAAFFDVSDPAVSYDGRWIAFAGVTKRDSAWRIWTCDASGGRLAAVTHSDRAIDLAALYGAAASGRFVRYDDFDPCWLPDGRIVFASTRFPMPAQQGSGVASNLWTVHADGSDLRRITAEHDGGEEPSIDPTSGRIVYARWFFNRHRAGVNAGGIASGFAEEMPSDTANLWLAGSIEHDGDHLRLAGGDPRTRAGEMAYQPVVLADTTFVGVRAEEPTLLGAGRLGIQVVPHSLGDARPLAGFGSPRGWSACSPAALPDGRIVFSMDEDGTGQFDLYVADAARTRITRLTGESGLMSLDAAVLAPRPIPPVPPYGMGWPTPADPLPHLTLDAILGDERTVRFDCLNVYANGPVDSPIPNAIPIRRDARIRFFAAVPRPGLEGGDSLVMVGESPVSPQGRVAVDRTPADVPLFEQLVDGSGQVLRSAHGPAHVAGYNYTRPGAGTKCVGCHVGHSAIPVPPSGAQAEYTNISPGARVFASSELAGTAGAAAIADRRTRGDIEQVAWLADSPSGQWIRLEWESVVEGEAVTLYAVRGRSRMGGPVRIRRGELVLFRGTREVRRIAVDRALSPEGTRVALGNVVFDALEFRPLSGSGKIHGRPVTGLAEIETIARLAWE